MESDGHTRHGGDRLARLGVKLYRYRTLVKRRWWVLALTVSIGLAIGGFRIFTTKTLYQSTGQLAVSEKLNIPQGSTYVEDENFFYGTQLTILQGADLQDRARRRLAVEAPDLKGEATVTATLQPRTSIFALTGVGPNPDYTQRFVDAVMDEFIKFKSEKRQGVAEQMGKDIAGELASLRKDMDDRSKELQQFMQKNNMAFWKQQAESTAAHLNDLKTAQNLLETEVRTMEEMTSDQLLLRSSSVPKGVQIADPNGNDASDLTRKFLETSQELVEKKALYDEKSKVWKPEHPKMIAIKEDIESLGRLLNTIKSQNAEATKGKLASAKAELASLNESIAAQEEKVNQASEKDAEYQRIKSSVDRSTSLYEKLAQSMNDVTVTQKTDQGTIQINLPATPAVQVDPGTLGKLLTGLLGGLGVGILVLLLLDRADDRVSSSTEIIEQFSEPILGQIPNISNTRTQIGLPLLQKEDERYTFAESFRSLRSSLVFMPNQGELRTLIVTSSIPNEGKSTIASNLGITMALAGARVLVVDADLRRGDLAQLFDVDGALGLSTVLRGEAPWQEVVKQTKYPTLTLLPRGPVTNQSGELLLVPQFDTILAEFKKEFDLTIFNTSPILATDDTATLAPSFDGTLMVMRSQYTSARLVHNALGALYQRQVNVLGLILNYVDTEMPDYYYYRYPKYYAA